MAPGRNSHEIAPIAVATAKVRPSSSKDGMRLVSAVVKANTAQSRMAIRPIRVASSFGGIGISQSKAATYAVNEAQGLWGSGAVRTDLAQIAARPNRTGIGS